MNNILEKIKNTTTKQRIISGAVGLVLIGCITAVAIQHHATVVKADGDRVSKAKQIVTKKADADKQAQLKVDQAKKEAQAKSKKAEADKQAKIKTEAEAKTKADNEAKEKSDAEKTQVAQAEQAKQQDQQAQAVSEQTSTQAALQQSNQPSYVADNSQSVPSYTPSAPNNTGGATTPATPATPATPTPTPSTPTPSTPTVSDDQKWLNAGYIRAPFPEGSGELANWLADRGYGGYTGNGEGWIRPY